MSAHPSGNRSPFSSAALILAQHQSASAQTPNKLAIKGIQKAPLRINSDSETDLSTSTENLSMEERYVLRHTARVEPQGQENLQETSGQDTPTNENRFSSNASTDSTRFTNNSGNRSISEARNPIYGPPSAQAGTSNRNSLKENPHSNRSSMDVSTCSYNTLIIHNDDSLYSTGNDFTNSLKKDRPRSYGNEHQQAIQEIAEIPDDYLSQCQVLKHLAKEIKLPNRRSKTRDSGVISENTDTKELTKFNKSWTDDSRSDQNSSITNSKLKSKSQPDLSRMIDIDLGAIEALMNENVLLKQQVNNYFLKVAKTQKLEEEVANIYRVHEELVQSCERREKLERAARARLQSELQRQQEFNKALKDQVDIYQSQLLAPSEHQILIAQLFTQNKELNAAKDRQEIELNAQRATLQEQRNHIGILDNALQNAQHNIRRLEEELRKKQVYVERLVQLQQTIQSKNGNDQRKLRLDYSDNDGLSKDSNRSGSSTNSGDTKWIQEKSGQIMRLESECNKLEDAVFRQNIAKGIEKNTHEAERILAEAKHDKLRYLEEVHSAQKRVGELQNHLKVLEGHLAQKDAVIKALQNPKACGSSFDSYNLSTDSFGLSPLVNNSNNSQASFNVSNVSFNTSLDQNYGQSNHLSSSSSLLANNNNNYPGSSITGAYISSGGVGVNYVTNKIAGNSQSSSPSLNFNNQSSCNLQNLASYSPNPNYDPPTPTNLNPPQFLQHHHTSYSPSPNNYDHIHHRLQHQASPSPNHMLMEPGGGIMGRKSIDDHHMAMKKQFDDQKWFKDCCFPMALVTKKPILPSDEVPILTSNSDAFLQKLAQQLDRERQDKREQETKKCDINNLLNSASNSNGNGNPKKTSQEDIVLLEKQGRCSQKIRTNALNMGNLVQTTNNVGQNMTDIPNNIDSPPPLSKTPKPMPKLAQNYSGGRGSSLPPRGLKPPRKMEYGRLSDTELKKHGQKIPSKEHPKLCDLKTLSLKRNGELHDFPMNEKLDFSKYQDYGSIKNDNAKYLNFSSNGRSAVSEFSRPEFTSTKNYQRLEERSPSRSKRSLLPKMTISSKNARDSVNSTSSSSNTNSRVSPILLHHQKTDSNMSNLTFQYYPHHSKTPPKYLPTRHYYLGAASPSKSASMGPPSICSIGSGTRNLPPPKPSDMKALNSGRESSVPRSDKRYKIQF